MKSHKNRQTKVHKKRSIKMRKKSKRKGGGWRLMQEVQKANDQIQKPGFRLLDKAQGSAEALVGTAATLALASNAGYATAAVLSSTGVLLALGGALIGALLIANKLANMYIQNKKMKSVMYDTMNILSSVFRLHDLLMKVFGVFLIFIFKNDEWNRIMLLPNNLEFFKSEQYKKLFEEAFQQRKDILTRGEGVTIKFVKDGKQETLEIKPGNMLLQIGMNKETQEHVIQKTKLLIINLLQTTTDKLLKSLEGDKDVEAVNFKPLVVAEIKRRKVIVSELSTSKTIGSTLLNGARTVVNTVANSAASSMGTLNRYMNRAFYAFYIKQDIIDNLTLIQSYSLDLKVQYDFTLNLYEREISFMWKPMWNFIQQLDEFRNYAVPRDIFHIIKSAIAQKKVSDSTFVDELQKEVEYAPDALMEAVKEKSGENSDAQ